MIRRPEFIGNDTAFIDRTLPHYTEWCLLVSVMKRRSLIYCCTDNYGVDVPQIYYWQHAPLNHSVFIRRQLSPNSISSACKTWKNVFFFSFSIISSLEMKKKRKICNTTKATLKSLHKRRWAWINKLFGIFLRCRKNRFDRGAIKISPWRSIEVLQRREHILLFFPHTSFIVLCCSVGGYAFMGKE